MSIVEVVIWDYEAKSHRRVRVAVTVDCARLARAKAQKAYANKSRKTRLASGAIILEVLP